MIEYNLIQQIYSTLTDKEKEILFKQLFYYKISNIEILKIIMNVYFSNQMDENISKEKIIEFFQLFTLAKNVLIEYVDKIIKKNKIININDENIIWFERYKIIMNIDNFKKNYIWV